MSESNPATYEDALRLGLAGEASRRFAPWRIFHREELFDVDERWPGNPGPKLTAFARREDCDDLACFEDGSDEIVLIEGWTGGGRSYQVADRLPSFADWVAFALKGDN